MTDIATRRLRAQRLTGKPFASAVEAVGWFGAMQSQDYGGAKWALGQRLHGATDEELDSLFDQGKILRTHVLRPTWHFVLPGDVRWLLELTGPRIRAGLAGRYRQLGIDEKVIARSQSAFTAALAGGREMTRVELGEILQAAGISPEGQRLPHLILAAELDRLLVSGPRRGKQFTYALLEERVPAAPGLGRTEAVAELTRRYFQSHGPALLQDFVWWSGLKAADARAGIKLAGGALEHQNVDGYDYWFAAESEPVRKTAGVAHLLPNFDEYTVAYRHRSAMVHPDRPFKPELFAFGSILSNVVIVGGQIHGAWRRTVERRGVRVEIRPLERLKPAERAAVEQAARRFSRFLGRPVEVGWT